MLTAILSRSRAVLRMILFLLVTAVLIPIHYMCLLIFGTLRVTRLWHRALWWILGLRVTVYGGEVKSQKQVLYLSNHLSYMDIFVLGALRDGVFIAKQDVAGWPVFGYLATLQKTIFIDRTRSGLEQAQGRILARMAQGYDLILFPEGTSTNGARVLPFKRALIPFDPVIDIQPVGIRVSHVDGVALSSDEQRDRYGWHGEMTLVPHLWDVFKGRNIDIEVHFLPIVNAADFPSHKEMVQSIHLGVDSVVTKA